MLWKWHYTDSQYWSYCQWGCKVFSPLGSGSSVHSKQSSTAHRALSNKIRFGHSFGIRWSVQVGGCKDGLNVTLCCSTVAKYWSWQPWPNIWLVIWLNNWVVLKLECHFLLFSQRWIIGATIGLMNLWPISQLIHTQHKHQNVWTLLYTFLFSGEQFKLILF